MSVEKSKIEKEKGETIVAESEKLDMDTDFEEIKVIAIENAKSLIEKDFAELAIKTDSMGNEFATVTMIKDMKEQDKYGEVAWKKGEVIFSTDDESEIEQLRPYQNILETK